MISLVFSFLPVSHDFKMSVCEINYVNENEFFVIRFYLFQDDLKEALYGDPLAHQLDEALVNTYILEKVKIHSNGHPISFTLTAIKEREDQVQVIFQSEKTTTQNLSNLLVSNKLLIEKFRKQTNMVYVTFPGHTKLTKILNIENTEGIFEF